MFATVLVCTVDTAAGVLTYASAGHPAALLLGGASTARPARGPRRRARAVAPDVPGEAPPGVTELPATGPFLSPVVSGWTWEDVREPFGVGDALLACTDGVLESRAPDGAEFGLEGVLDAAGRDPVHLVDAVAAASLRHAVSTARRDDHTLVHVLREEVREEVRTPAPKVR